jgi:hypothetical protein
MLPLHFFGDKTLDSIGFQDGDLVCISDGKPIMQPSEHCSQRSTQPRQLKQRNSAPEAVNCMPKKTRKQHNSNGHKKDGKMMQQDYSTNINQDKVNHSKDLTRGFEESSSLFCERRQKQII